MWRLAIVAFLITGAVNLQLPYYATYARGAGLGSGAMALLLGGYVAVLLPGLGLFGGISERLGVRPVLIAALVSSSIGTLLTLIWPSVWGLLPARWFQGLGVVLLMGAGASWMRHLEGPERAGRVLGWTTAGGFGLGAVVTGFSPTVWDRPLTYPVWMLAMALSVVSLFGERSVPPRDPWLPWIRAPRFPPGSGLPGLSLGLTWGVAGCVVVLAPGLLADAGDGSWSGGLLLSMLLAGVAAQLHARRLDSLRCLGIGAVTLPVGVAGLVAGLFIGRVEVALLGAMIAGTSSHGYGYVGSLVRVTGLDAQPAPVVSGAFCFAYIGFGGAPILLGLAIDLLGAEIALSASWVLVVAGSLAIGLRVRFESRKA